VQKSQLVLQTTIEGCDNIMQTGMKTFNGNQTVAVSVWKGVFVRFLFVFCLFFFEIIINNSSGSNKPHTSNF
jgi:hypothetical protein